MSIPNFDHKQKQLRAVWTRRGRFSRRCVIFSNKWPPTRVLRQKSSVKCFINVNVYQRLISVRQPRAAFNFNCLKIVNETAVNNKSTVCINVQLCVGVIFCVRVCSVSDKVHVHGNKVPQTPSKTDEIIFCNVCV